MGNKGMSQMAKATNNTINEQIERRFELDDNYKERITRFLEQEGNRIRKEADQESTSIISRAREEYNQRLSKFLEQEEENIRKRAEQDAENIINEALEERKRIFTEARNMAKSKTDEAINKVKTQAEQNVSTYVDTAKQRAEKIADKYREECKNRADQEAATIIDSANEQAIQIVAQAKEKARKQTEEEKREEVKRIIESAKQQSAEIITQAKQAADKEAEKTASTIISLAQQKARQLISETMDKLKNGEEEKLTKLISGEQHKSELEATDIFAEVKLEAEQLISKTINDTDWRGVAAEKDNKIEGKNETEFVDEASGQVKEPKDSEAMPDIDQFQENIHASQERKADIRMEVTEATATVGSEEIPQLENESSLPASEAAQTEQDELAVAEVTESSDTFAKAKGLLIGEKGSDTVGQNDEPLDVEIVLGLSVDRDISAKLYKYLVNTPEIKLVHTLGNSDRGTIITVVLDKPIPLVEMFSSKIPEAQVTGEPPSANGKKRKARRINIARKEADIVSTEDSQE